MNTKNINAHWSLEFIVTVVLVSTLGFPSTTMAVPFSKDTVLISSTFVPSVYSLLVV
ncbi:hypothetical protein D3C84_1230250 [compost metagenome]